MNSAFQKMLAKKKADMPEGRMNARASVLDDLMGNMDDRDSKKLGMKKVSVTADSKEGLKEGLDKAKDVVDQHPGMSDEDESMESPEEEASETPEMEASENKDEPSTEELMAQIEELKAKLAKLGV